MSLQRRIEIDASSRVLVVAPHPDDESLVTGALLHRAVRLGAAVHVAYLTDGENNPWAQVVYERRWATGPVARARFGALRRSEALAALAELGVGDGDVSFLHRPDQGTTRRLLAGDAEPLSSLEALVDKFRPSLVVGPSILDLHPDHSALGVILRLILGGRTSILHLETIVHNPSLRRSGSGALRLAVDEAERRHKRAAIACHRSQKTWRGGWLHSFAAADEVFWPVDGSGWPWPIQSTVRAGGVLTLSASLPPRPRAFGRRTLLVVGRDGDSHVRCARALWPSLPRTCELIACGDGIVVGKARSVGGAWRGSLHLSFDRLPDFLPLFAKVARRFGFFDGEGWSRLAGPAPSGPSGCV